MGWPRDKERVHRGSFYQQHLQPRSRWGEVWKEGAGGSPWPSPALLGPLRSLQRGSAGVQSRIGSGRTPRKLSGNCHPLADADPTCRSPAWGRRFLGLQPPSRSSPRSQVPGPKEVNRESPGEPGSPAGGPAPGRGTSARHAGTSQRPGAEERAAHEGSGTGAQGGRRGEPCKGRGRRAGPVRAFPRPRPAGGRGTQ